MEAIRPCLICTQILPSKLILSIGSIVLTRLQACLKEAQRSNGFGRRCRAQFVMVMSVVDVNGRLCAEGTSLRDESLKYGRLYT